VVGEKRKTGIDGGAVVVGEQKTACVDGEAAMDERWRRQRGTLSRMQNGSGVVFSFFRWAEALSYGMALFSLFLFFLEPKAKGF
jgi:hypothetical protein